MLPSGLGCSSRYFLISSGLPALTPGLQALKFSAAWLTIASANPAHPGNPHAPQLAPGKIPVISSTLVSTST